MFRDHILACYITDPSGLELRHRIGIDIIAWECDYPHTDTTWPESPEFAWKELQDAGCSDAEIQKITWENSCRFFDWDPFQHTPKDQATVGRLAVPGQGRRYHPDAPRGVEEAQRERRDRHLLAARSISAHGGHAEKADWMARSSWLSMGDVALATSALATP